MLFQSGIEFKVIKSSVGIITEEDVRLVIAEENGIIVGFHTEIDNKAKQLADRYPDTLVTFDTIYEIMDWAKQLSQKEKEGYQLRNVTGKAEVIRVFEEDQLKGKYIIGLQIKEGSFETGQTIQSIKGEKTQGTFEIQKIEPKK